MIGGIVSIIALVLEIFVKRSNASEATLKKYYEFIKAFGEDTGSSKLFKQGEAQLEWLKKNPRGK